MSEAVEVAAGVTLSRAEYEAKAATGQAGTVRRLGLGAGTVATWRKQRPDWEGIFWAQGYSAYGAGTYLGPANVG